MFTSYNLIQISNSVKIKLEDGKLKFFGQKGQAKNTLIRNIGDQLQVEEYIMYFSLLNLNIMKLKSMQSLTMSTK